MLIMCFFFFCFEITFVELTYGVNSFYCSTYSYVWHLIVIFVFKHMSKYIINSKLIFSNFDPYNFLSFMRNKENLESKFVMGIVLNL